MTTDTATRVITNATCTFCGCLCDDIELTVTGDRITKAENACELGRAWFLDHQPDGSGPEAVIDGVPATVERALDEAARLLATARYPVVYGLSDTTAEAQRVAERGGRYAKLGRGGAKAAMPGDGEEGGEVGRVDPH